MNVGELMGHLNTMSRDALVVVAGFDSWGLDYADKPEIVQAVPVKPQSHGPSYVENDAAILRHHEVTGPVVDVVYIAIGERP